MPFALIAMFALQICCAIHAVRSGNVQPWLWIILFFPLIGSFIYIVTVIVPEFSRSRAGVQVAQDVKRLIDPNREYRERFAEAELVGSAESKRALAEECMRRNEFSEAVALYESAATGIHAEDPALLHGLARARFADGDSVGAQKTLDDLRAANPDWQSADAHLLYARALEGQGRFDEALSEYEALARYFPGEEARVRLALLLQRQGEVERSREIFLEVVRNIERGVPHYRRSQRDWLQVARRNLDD